MTGLKPIIAEVSDKEPTITAIWGMAVCFSVVGFLLCRWRRIVAVMIVAPLVALWAVAVFLEIYDPYVGPAILSELGRGYVAQAYVALLIPFLFVGLGVCSPRSGRQSTPTK